MTEPLLDRGLHADNELSQDPKWDNVEVAWDTIMAEPEGDRVFFDHIVIAGDGGLSEIGTKEELWYSTRYLGSAILIIFVFYNIYFIIAGDVGLIMDAKKATAADGTANIESDYLISKSLLDYFCAKTHNEALLKHIHPRVIISWCELLILAYYLIVLLQDIFAALFKTGHAQWKGISEVCWIDLPDLSLFSAMRLLGLVVPQKLSYDINYALWYDVGSKAKNLGWIFFSRPLALIIGMDCFLVKYRLASQYIMHTNASMTDVLGGIIFLNQVLGVVNLSFTIKSRLYRFVFGGEDGIMSEREIVRQDVWESFVCYKIFQKYPRHKAIALMLSWCDDDFQMLALNESSAGEFPGHA